MFRAIMYIIALLASLTSIASAESAPTPAVECQTEVCRLVEVERDRLQPLFEPHSDFVERLDSAGPPARAEQGDAPTQPIARLLTGAAR